MDTVPIWFDKPANVWLGIALLPILFAQVSSGIILFRGVFGPNGWNRLRSLHLLNALLLVGVVAVHAYWGIGIWFFDFRLG